MNGRNGVLYIGKLKGAITMDKKEKFRKSIVDMVGQMQDECWLKCVFFYVSYLLSQEEGGEDHGDGRQEDLPAAL